MDLIGYILVLIDFVWYSGSNKSERSKAPMSRNEELAIKNMLRGYKKVNASMVRILEGYGLVVSRQGKHYKVRRIDNIGGIVTIAKTPSDNRAGLNISRYIIQLIEA